MSRAQAHWLFAAPALALMALVNVLPLGQALWLGRGWSRLASDSQLWGSLGRTTAFTAASVGLELVLGLSMALLLMRPFPGRGLARAAAILPWALPGAVMAMAWRWIYNPDYGVLGDLLHRAGLSATPHIAWLASPGKAFFACLLAEVWKTTPFMALLLMSGLAAIPKELYEAAGIDGAGPARRFLLITLPALRPTLALAVILRAVQAFGIFDLIQVLTGGGPGGSTRMIALYAYDTVFRYLEPAYGCVLTVLMGVLLCVMASGVFLAAGAGREA